MTKENKQFVRKLAFNFGSVMGYLSVNGKKHVADFFMEDFSKEEIDKLDELGREYMRNDPRLQHVLENADETVKKILEEIYDAINAAN